MDPHPTRSSQYRYHCAMSAPQGPGEGATVGAVSVVAPTSAHAHDKDFSLEAGPPLATPSAPRLPHRQILPFADTSSLSISSSSSSAHQAPSPLSSHNGYYQSTVMAASLSQSSVSSRAGSGPSMTTQSSSAPPLPFRSTPRPTFVPSSSLEDQSNDFEQGGTNGSPEAGDAEAAASDVAQHCLLFPTYATRHSRSGSKDPLDWNIRVKGWAFSKRSNRRTRLVMSMARKIAGVTKDNEVHEILDSRIGMFLASNTQGAKFSIQCVGVASTNHMEIAESDTPATESVDNELLADRGENVISRTNNGAEQSETVVDFLKQDLEGHTLDSNISAALAQAELEVVTSEAEKQEREMFRRSLELGGLLVSDQDGEIVVASMSTEHNPSLLEELDEEEDDSPEVEKAGSLTIQKTVKLTQETAIEATYHDQGESDKIGVVALETVEKTARYRTGTEIPLSQLENERAFPVRFGKGAATLVKNVIRRYKPTSEVAIGSESYGRGLPEAGHKQRLTGILQSGALDRNISELMADGDSTHAPNSATRHAHSGLDRWFGEEKRTGPDQNVEPQSMTVLEDLGGGIFPTVHVSSRPGGHFGGTLRVSHEEVQALAANSTAGSSSNGRPPKFLRLQGQHEGMHKLSHGIVNLIDPEGISVISDIDDTIKETNVTAGARVILRNTFLRAMQEVPGMATVYKRWWERGAAIHYVSNSPWQLIPSLLEFFHTHMFPPGSAHLRLHDSMLKTYFARTPPGEHKRRSIRELLMDFPDRKFILIGDSGEIDMEIYTEMALEHPNQVVKIFIRDLSKSRSRAAEVTAQSQPGSAPVEQETELDSDQRSYQQSQPSSTRTSPSLMSRSFSSLLLISGNKNNQNGPSGFTSGGPSVASGITNFFAGRRGSGNSTISDTSATIGSVKDAITPTITRSSSPTKIYATLVGDEEGSLGPMMEPSGPLDVTNIPIQQQSQQHRTSSSSSPSSPMRSPRHLFSRTRASTSSSLHSNSLSPQASLVSVSNESPPHPFSKQVPGDTASGELGATMNFRAIMNQSTLAFRRKSSSATNLLSNLSKGNSSSSSLSEVENSKNATSPVGSDAINITDKGRKSGWAGFRRRRGSMSPGSPLSSSLTMSWTVSATEESSTRYQAYPFPAVGSYTSTSLDQDGLFLGDQNEHESEEDVIADTEPQEPPSVDANDDDDDNEDRPYLSPPPPLPARRTATSTRLNSFTSLFSTTPSSAPSSSTVSPLLHPMTPFGGSAAVQSTQGTPSSPNSSNLAATLHAETIWQERMERCKRRLPNPEMLSMFESAEELDQCAIVSELFRDLRDLQERAEEPLDT